MRLTLKAQPISAAKTELRRLHVSARSVGARGQPVPIAGRDDPIHAWREKLLDAFDGMARQSPVSGLGLIGGG